jgi:NADH-dependent peroxiredoxin subunit F
MGRRASIPQTFQIKIKHAKITSMQYDLIIIGGGPAGTAAGVYAARKHIKTLLIVGSFGGQSIESNEIQNWIGTPAISGLELAKNLKNHVKAYADGFIDIKEGEKVESLAKIGGDGFVVTTSKSSYKSKTVLIATGSNRRKLNVPGAEEFEGKGITYCASCDGPFFEGKDVAVIGGGNAGFESAAQLLAYCKSVTLLEVGKFRADAVTISKVTENPAMTAMENTSAIEIKGDSSVKSLIYKKTAPFAVDNLELKVEGIFVEIGQIPATDFAEGLVELDEYKRVKTDPMTQRTSLGGIWAAGDCTDVLYHQNNIAAGDAVKALEDIYLELQRMK